MRLYFIIHDRGIKLMLDLSNKYKCNKAIKKLKKKENGDNIHLEGLLWKLN